MKLNKLYHDAKLKALSRLITNTLCSISTQANWTLLSFDQITCLESQLDYTKELLAEAKRLNKTKTK